MRSHNAQLDIFEDDPIRLAKRNAAACRVAAEVARVDPHWTAREQVARHQHYLAEAERYDRIASANGQRAQTPASD
ncbi:hypothetical protein [Stenotrophomonas pictorum]|uniref:hypothetical protein n=1 Tax=Stenotrophomonas pictorum TaxID=86184 RepID=UPI0011AE5FC3|nr:hypothetical protein [Stenotrophomonas pictorum]